LATEGDVVEAVIARNEAVNALNGLSYHAFDRAHAEVAGPSVPAGADFFRGVPTFVKDNVDVAGMPTKRGTDACTPRGLPISTASSPGFTWPPG
jgi:amidase